MKDKNGGNTESYKNLFQNAKPFNQDLTNQSNTNNNQTPFSPD